MGEKLVFCISDVFRDGGRIRRSIHDVVDKAFESGIKMSSCRYKDHSITLDVSFEPEGGFDKMMLEILYGDRIRRTIERLNNEWLEKMWKASDDDLLVFRLEQICKSLDRKQEEFFLMQDRLEKIRKTIFVKDLE